MKRTLKHRGERLFSEETVLQCRSAHMEDIVEMLHELTRAECSRIVAECDTLISGTDIGDDKRVACIKILIGLLPLSLDVIERRLRLREGRHAYENHFTLFCFLDLCVLKAIGVSHVVKERLLSSLSEYLHNVSTEKAHAAWMCGDLLGDHWENDTEAMNVLLLAAEEADYVPGRLGALHGIECLVNSDAYPGSKTSERVTDALFRVANLDRSAKVRRWACEILDRVISKAGGAKEKLSTLQRLTTFVAENPMDDVFKDCCLSMLRQLAASDRSVRVRSYAQRMIKGLRGVGSAH